MISRRQLLIGGGAGIGLVVGWALWPRDYPANLTASPGETVFGAWLKIGSDGHVTVAVPQVEHGQGVYTAIAQIVADELGADWRTVGVEAAPLNPLYGNPLALAALTGMAPGRLVEAPMLTGGSSSIRRWEEPCRRAGAAARCLLLKAAARRWDADWEQLNVADGFVTRGKQRLRFADLAAAAVGETLPAPLPLATSGAGRLTGKPLPRLDAPAKVDGSANFAGDIRLPDMVHAAVRQGPVGANRLVRIDKAAADRVPGVLAVIEAGDFVAVAATTGWAAERALDAMQPRFETRGPVVDDAGIARALAAALKRPGVRMSAVGEVDPLLTGAGLVTARYDVRPGLHAAMETPSATAAFRNDRLELWLATQAPGVARAAAGHAAGLSEAAVTVHPLMIGGSFGEALDTRVAEQAALLAVKLRRPVSVRWSRGEAARQDQVRPPVAAVMTARLAANGGIAGWRAQIASPATGATMRERFTPGLTGDALSRLAKGDPYSVSGAATPYRLPASAVDWHEAELGLPTGHLRGGGDSWTCFFTESFLDEVVRVANQEPVSYRIGMLGGDARAARCLSTAAALGGWDGGVAGSGQGIALHSMRGSHVAVLAEASFEGGRVRVARLVAAVDCGRVINPDLVRQQIEGGLIFGLAQATGAATGYARGVASATNMGDLNLPRLADAPDITVELIASEAAPGGVSELAVPPVAPAIANALASATGRRYRTLPLA
ncbi:xanthine dehydrogenase family protein molybdopterin-binding subunit [Sphingomonas sp.]|jgi:isoquinoline 1-oxidoreductase beta subunit|uniref:xanthine dehydrogenase family protein molybdopterin-binding subunit n=1 Tax=Sphingomonas sp. TaxID=28214 RepID=UPI002D7FEF96|nr:molybdopterin cofactor-binding domain-containing protein [Sphingomonas sp.]HEU0043091.1 molybdopterin cofactor-binding domain-containing protein [Sphingomonas sp.]